MYGNTPAKYIVDRVRVRPTDSGLLTHVNHPAAKVTLPTLTQKSTSCRPPRRKKAKPIFQMTKIHQGNSSDIPTLHESETT